MATTQFPLLPQQLPKTQADWDRVCNVLQSWMQKIQGAQWSAPTFKNSWTNYSTVANPAGFLQDGSGRIWLRGSLSGGNANTTIFTLPWAPKYRQIFYQFSTERVDVDTSGNVIANPSGSGSIAFLSLDGLSFDLRA